MSSQPIVLRAGDRTLQLHPDDPVLMGVVNTNPGSFSDTAPPGTTDELLARALSLVDAGAGVIDVGVDSGVTHDRARPVADQIAGAVPLVTALAERGIVVSIDTVDVEVATACLDAGAVIVNDVSGLADPALARLCADRGAALVVLHTRAGHKQEHFPEYDDVVADVLGFLTDRVNAAVLAGVPRDRIVVDPGLDYAKKPHESVLVLAAYDRIAALGHPILSGVSRKYFAGILTGAEPPDRLPETLATVAAVRHWPGLLRVHDVDECRRFLTVLRVLDGHQPFPAYDMDDDTLKWVLPTRD